jgi:hypothetical protein
MTKRSAPSPISGPAAKKQMTSDSDIAGIDTAVDNLSISFSRTAPSAATESEPIHLTEPTEPVQVQGAMNSNSTKHAIITKDARSNVKVAKVGKGNDQKEKKPATVHTLFSAWKPTITKPESNPFWGIKPRTGDVRPHADQPAARSSDASVNPPLWEDRGFRIKRGSRHVKYFGPLKPEGADSGPDLDQEDLLVVKLMDMRKKSARDMTPRRTPMFYAFEHGKPQDWNCMQAIKALNDRRGQAIDRITVDAPWSRTEREYLASLLAEAPDASIWELAERHNDRFMGADHTAATAFSYAGLSTGRTVESVRHEYRTYKPVYDKGEAPQSVRWRVDKSIAGKALVEKQRVDKAFGPSDKRLEKKFDADAERNGKGDDATKSDSDDGRESSQKSAKPNLATAKNATKKLAQSTKATPTMQKPRKISTEQATQAATSPPDSGDESTPVVATSAASQAQVAAATAMATQPKLTLVEEDLLTLAGLHSPEQIRASPARDDPPALSPRARRASTPSSLASSPPSDTSSRGSPPQSNRPVKWRTGGCSPTWSRML